MMNTRLYVNNMARHVSLCSDSAKRSNNDKMYLAGILQKSRLIVGSTMTKCICRDKTDITSNFCFNNDKIYLTGILQTSRLIVGSTMTKCILQGYYRYHV